MRLGSNGSSQKADVVASEEHRQHLRASTERKQTKPFVSKCWINKALPLPFPRGWNANIFQPLKITCLAHDYYRTVDRLITHVRLQNYRENTLTETMRRKIAEAQSFLCAFPTLLSIDGFELQAYVHAYFQIRLASVVYLRNSLRAISRNEGIFNWQLDKYFNFALYAANFGLVR